MTPTPFFGYANYDELNAQYDIEATIPDFGAFVNRIVSASEDARATLTTRLDVRFGPTLAETYDVFYPTKTNDAGKAPALFFVHGGFWKATTSKEWSYVAKGLCEMGFVVIVESYALRPHVTISEIVRQHRAAFAHFWAHADEYGVDKDRIVVAGHSAGGHAVAALLETQWDTDYGLPAEPIKAGIPVSGLFDLRPLQQTSFGPILGMSDAEAIALSPMLSLPRSKRITAVIYGTQETPEFERQSTDFAAALLEEKQNVEVLPLAHNHFTILDELADKDGAIARQVLAVA